MRGFLIGLILGLLLLPVGAAAWFRWGHPPVAVADKPFPFEKLIVNVPLHARIDREMPAHAAMSATPANLLLGADVYRQNCASCHGQYGRPSVYGGHMYPHAPQLWAPHGHGVVGVSDDPAGETYWKVKNGIRLSGMPGFSKVLNETEMWQVTVLLANADKPLPDPVMAMLKQPLLAPSVVPVPEPEANTPGATTFPVDPVPNQ
jgi:thiosulfate dehydrogenase